MFERYKSSMKSHLMSWFFVLISSLLLSACSLHTHADKFNGVAGIRGEPVEYQQTNTWALHALWIATSG
jgi:outer membrane biogenesis lipoprotein LolB